MVHQIWWTGADIDVYKAASAALDGTKGIDRC